MASATKFTEKAQEAILNAQRETESRNISQFEPIALLLALLDQSDGLVPETLRKLGVDPAAVTSTSARSICCSASLMGWTPGQRSCWRAMA
jgi:ATP-dependent Clp protease ATP-binding subunit ClpA